MCVMYSSKLMYKVKGKSTYKTNTIQIYNAIYLILCKIPNTMQIYNTTYIILY